MLRLKTHFFHPYTQYLQSAAAHKSPEDLIYNQVRLLALIYSFVVKDMCTLPVPVLHQGALLESRLSFSSFGIWEEFFMLHL